MITLDSQWIAGQFGKRAGRAVSDQLNAVVAAIVEHMKYQHHKEVVGAERARVRKELQKMFADANRKTIYAKFYTWLEQPEMYKQAARGRLEYSDVFPLVYLTGACRDETARGEQWIPLHNFRDTGERSWAWPWGMHLGAPFEGTLRIAREIIDSLQPEPGELRYTDDTRMIIGVAQSLIACRGLTARIGLASSWRIFAWNRGEVMARDRHAFLTASCGVENGTSQRDSYLGVRDHSGTARRCG